MKTLLKTFVLAMLVAVPYALPAFAQCEPEAKQAQYDIFIANRRAKTVEERSKAVEAGNKVLAMCKDSTDPGDKEIVDYIVKDLPRIEDWIKTRPFIGAAEKDKQSGNFQASLNAGKELLAAQGPDSKIVVDLQLYIATAAFELSLKPEGAAFRDEAIQFSKDAIASIEGGKPSANWGYFDFNYKMDNDAASKANALGWMNFTIGSVLRAQKNLKDAAVYMFKASQFNSSVDSDPVYSGLGEYYFTEALRLQKEAEKKFDLNTEADDVEGKKILRLAKAFSERGLDAYARAQAAAAKAGKKDVADSIGKRITALYAFRFEGKTEGKDEFVANLLKSPLPDPGVEPAPVAEEPAPEPAPAPTTTTTTTSGN